MILAHPYWLLLLLLLPIPWLVAKRKGYLGFPRVRQFGNSTGGWIFHLVPLSLIVAGFVALFIAIARPQSVHVISNEKFKSRDIVIAVDISGSMSANYGPIPPSVVGETELDKDFPGRPDRKKGQPSNSGYGYGSTYGERRIDAAQAAVLDFVRNRFRANANDRVGILVFDTDQYWSWPLTHDLKMIFRKVHFADAGLGGGTNFGNSKPGPMDACVEHLDEMGKASTRVFIMVTDAEDSLYADTFARLTDLASQYNMKLYVIGIGESMANSDILKLAEATGGKGFSAKNPTEMQECFKTIDSMEQSLVTVEKTENREELFHYFAFAAVVLFLVGTLCEALVLNS